MCNSDNIKKENSNEDYNNEPVVYCKKCFSLKIMILNDEIDYCDQCGSTDIDSTDIESWEKMYYDKYGKTYININKNKNGRKEKF